MTKPTAASNEAAINELRSLVVDLATAVASLTSTLSTSVAAPVKPTASSGFATITGHGALFECPNGCKPRPGRPDKVGPNGIRAFVTEERADGCGVAGTGHQKS